MAAGTINPNPKSSVNFRYRVKNKAALAGCAAATAVFSAFLINYYLLNPGETDIVKFFNTEEIQIGMGVAGAVILVALLSYGRFGKKMRPEDEAVANAALTRAHQEALRNQDRAHQRQLQNQWDASNRNLTQTTRALDNMSALKNDLEARLNTANTSITSLQSERDTDRTAHTTALSAKDEELIRVRLEATTQITAREGEITRLRKELNDIAKQQQRAEAHQLVTANATPSHIIPPAPKSRRC